MVTEALERTRTVRAGDFALATFTSALLVFMVEPMVGKLLLPLLGGSPAVWATTIAFFQAMLLVGYGYAHWLQRYAPRQQVAIHGVILAVAALTLPLRVNTLIDPSADHPNVWLLATLALSVGAPFAALSATAPLVQSWFSNSMREGQEPYQLYAASNLGSLLALLAYPLAIEPVITLSGQRYAWSATYGCFALGMIALGVAASRAPMRTTGALEQPASWRQRAEWIALAALPSSLMLGLTTFLATDVASAPFLWVVPLALYLLTFVIAFQHKPAIGLDTSALLQACFLPFCAVLIYMSRNAGVQLVLQPLCFFVSALVCHQRLVATRPSAERLTDFYFCLSIGGVVGGAFNAFLAPAIFNDVIEYPLVLALVALAAPPSRSPAGWRQLAAAFAGILALAVFWSHQIGGLGLLGKAPLGLFLPLLVLAGAGLRGRPVLLSVLVTALLLSGHHFSQQVNSSSQRSFFGVLKQYEMQSEELGGSVRLLVHGTTIHGAQAIDETHRCRPLTYYAPESVIGSAFRQALAPHKPPARLAVVGLGTGAVASYTRPGDRLTFYEIDPLVVRVASQSGHFSYTTTCAHGLVDYITGDARLSLVNTPSGALDLMLVDAFSSDAVPAHLLTVEALRLYLSKLKPDGVLVLHLTNRQMDLRGPAIAAAIDAGGVATSLDFNPNADQAARLASAQQVVIVAKSPAALAPFRTLGTPSDPEPARAWTDDYMNIVGAIVSRIRRPLHAANRPPAG